MITENQLRYYEVKIGEEWKRCNMLQLEEGDIARGFEPNGDPVLDPQGLHVFKVQARANVQVDFLTELQNHETR